MDDEAAKKIVREELLPSFEHAVGSLLTAIGLFHLAACAHSRYREQLEAIGDTSLIDELTVLAGEANKIFPLNQATPLSPKSIIETAVELLTDPRGGGLQGRILFDPWDPDELKRGGIPPWMKVPDGPINNTEH